MAKKSTKSTPVVQTYNLTVQQKDRNRKELADWRRAIQSAESLSAPNWKYIQDLYQNMILDTHLSSVMQKRIFAITNVDWVMVDKNGEEVEEITDALDSTFFETVLTRAIESRMFGPTVVQIDWWNKVAELIPRAHVNPRTKLVLPNPYVSNQGISYNEPPYNHLTLEVGDPEDLGLIIKCAPYVIMKRGNISDWATFCEIFGMPLRVAKYDPNMPNNRVETEKALENMGSAAFVVLPNGAEIEFPSAGSTQQNDVYDRFADFCNKEISKCIVGQTMTTEDGASLSQSQVHQKAEDSIIRNDLKFIERLLNEKFVPLLIAQGVSIPEGARIQPIEEEQTLDKKTRLDMDLRIHKEVAAIESEYFAQEYNVPLDKNAKPKAEEKLKETLKEKPIRNSDDFFVAAPALGATIDHIYYGHECGCEIHLSDSDTPSYPLPIQTGPFITRALKRIFANKGRFNGIDKDLFDATFLCLLDAVDKGYGIRKPDPKDKIYTYGELLKKSTWPFAARKTKQQQQDLAALASEYKTFSKFKAAAAKIVQDYNQRWLETEYNTARRSAIMAERWQRIWSRRDVFPNLKYLPSRAATPREAHKVLYGKIRPVGDPFWDKYYPPSAFLCQCDVEPTRQPATDLPETLPDLHKSFDNNSGKSGVLLKSGQYELPKPSEDKEAISKSRNHLAQYPLYVRIYASDKGWVDQHYLHDEESDLQHNIEMGIMLADLNHEVKLLPYIRNQKGVDADVDGKLFDFKVNTTNNEQTIKSALKKAEAQGAKWCFLWLKEANDIQVAKKGIWTRFKGSSILDGIVIKFKEEIKSFSRAQIINRELDEFLK